MGSNGVKEWNGMNGWNAMRDSTNECMERESRIAEEDVSGLTEGKAWVESGTAT